MPARPTRPALRERYDRRRQEMVYAAAKVFAERGYDQTTMQDLAALDGPGHRRGSTTTSAPRSSC